MLAGSSLLVLAFAVSSVIKFAQGSSTTAMIVTSGMIVAMIDPTKLTFHPAYLVAAIGGGSLVGSWMNDSGFWIYAKMGGLTEVQTLRSWTPARRATAIATTTVEKTGVCVRGATFANAFGMSPSRPMAYRMRVWPNSVTSVTEKIDTTAPAASTVAGHVAPRTSPRMTDRPALCCAGSEKSSHG